MEFRPNERFVRGAMLASSTFTTLLGLAMLLGAGPLAERLGVTAVLLRMLGIPLLALGFNVWYHARLQWLHPPQAWAVVGLDLLYAAGCVALLATDPWGLTPLGRATTLAVAAVLVVLAGLQFVGMRRVHATT